MKIGIIVHSKTGNTLQVAKKLKKNFIADGHLVNIEEIIAINDDEREPSKVRLTKVPIINEYDFLIFGAPVRGFALSPVMAFFMTQSSILHNKKVSCFVTQFFPFPWMGGKQAIEQMKSICVSKKLDLIETAIVNWSSIRRNKKINEAVEKLRRTV
ncbi:Flavodoxin/nitric oxide synthase [Petrocella atlantisensis]|uniref:Flavodoxin/nitric oxide synthase n=1 Tax=Petrocella atlantisensis TaxID=2173034 RepID=A0A3P7NTL7_9FIRM|nr:flavodoxin [Petrocella atlantisensis]VDN46195.1 Flavodoxin/nitric oxide synthase [Petrocella atlantisensis]